MKKLLILLFTPLICLSQGDFRKMNWGESSKILKEKYSDIIFQKEIQGEITILSCEETVSGIQTTVAYSFTGDKFFAGVYLFGFDSDSKESIDHLKDFNLVSARLRNKYQMTREDVWINDDWKDDPNNLPHALDMTHVSLIEKGANDETLIVHSLGKENGELIHRLIYTSENMMNKIQDSMNDDF